MRHGTSAEGGRERRAVVAFVPPGRSSAPPRREGAGVVMVSDKLLQRWETVYREYGLTSELVGHSAPGDRAVARRMARASTALAGAWREIEVEPGLPWWVVAALSTAAQAFEAQARDWSARARQGNRAEIGRSRPVAVDDTDRDSLLHGGAQPQGGSWETNP